MCSRFSPTALVFFLFWYDLCMRQSHRILVQSLPRLFFLLLCMICVCSNPTGILETRSRPCYPRSLPNLSPQFVRNFGCLGLSGDGWSSVSLLCAFVGLELDRWVISVCVKLDSVVGSWWCVGRGVDEEGWRQRIWCARFISLELIVLGYLTHELGVAVLWTVLAVWDSKHMFFLVFVTWFLCGHRTIFWK